MGLNDQAHELAKREAEKEKKKLEEQNRDPASAVATTDSPVSLLPPVEISAHTPEPDKSDGDSDSTIGAVQGEGILSDDLTSFSQVCVPSLLRLVLG